MPEQIQYQRLLDEKAKATEKKIRATLGTGAVKLWEQMRDFLQENYDFKPELSYFGKKYGWCFRYRRKNKTLCVLYPESGAFTVLVTLGKKEIAEVHNNLSNFNKQTQKVFLDAHQYHDGKWVYKRILNSSDLKDARLLISSKTKPKGLKGS